MKRMKKRFWALLLAGLLCFAGCATEAPADGGNTTDGEAESLARIAELEAELQKEREENYISESALSAEIEKLKSEIAKLTNKDESNTTPDAQTMIFHYKVENEGATITGYEGSAALVQIPATLDGYPVKKIGERAFEGNTALAAVVVPEGVEVIDWFAFYDCTFLLDITIPASVSEIGHAVFDGCTNLTVVCPAGSYTEDYAKSYGIPYINK